LEIALADVRELADLIERYADGDGRQFRACSCTGHRIRRSHSIDAASARHTVGYESPSQFSREYRRLFGAALIRDIERPMAKTIP
jgi:hypothetical protein